MSEFEPQFDATMQGWIHKYLKTNYWRVERTMTYDDAFQEAGLVFAELVVRYPDVDNQGWFMSLFKKSWAGHFYDLAMKASKIRTNELFPSPVYEDEDDSSVLDNVMGEQDNEGRFEILLEQAPEEVREVLSLMLNAPAEVLEMVAGNWKANGHNRPFGNRMLCHLLGKDPSHHDLEGAVRRYLSN